MILIMKSQLLEKAKYSTQVYDSNSAVSIRIDVLLLFEMSGFVFLQLRPEWYNE